MDRELISTGKFLSLVLRHHPEKIGITLDEEGWVEIGDLLAASNRSGKKLTRPLLERVVPSGSTNEELKSPQYYTDTLGRLFSLIAVIAE